MLMGHCANLLNSQILEKNNGGASISLPTSEQVGLCPKKSLQSPSSTPDVMKIGETDLARDISRSDKGKQRKIEPDSSTSDSRAASISDSDASDPDYGPSLDPNIAWISDSDASDPDDGPTFDPNIASTSRRSSAKKKKRKTTRNIDRKIPNILSSVSIPGVLGINFYKRIGRWTSHLW
jgi:hypothetical protein